MKVNKPGEQKYQYLHHKEYKKGKNRGEEIFVDTMIAKFPELKKKVLRLNGYIKDQSGETGKI